MKNFFRLIALVAVFVLSSFGASDAMTYSPDNMSDLTPIEFARQMVEYSEDLPSGAVTLTEPTYAGTDADYGCTLYVSHMGRYMTVTFRCDKAGKVNSVLLNWKNPDYASSDEINKKCFEAATAGYCILRAIGLTNSEIKDFIQHPDFAVTGYTEKEYSRIYLCVKELHDVDTVYDDPEYGIGITTVHSDLYYVTVG